MKFDGSQEEAVDRTGDHVTLGRATMDGCRAFEATVDT